MRQNEPYRLACEALMGIFEQNNLSLYRLGHSEETSAIESLLDDLNMPENLAHLETVGAVAWKEELERDNQAFIDVVRQRSASRSDDDTLTDSEAFKQLKTTLDLTEDILNALYSMNDPEGIRGAVDEINQYIREANAVAKQSQPHSPNGE